MSILRVNTIQNSAGTGALTIDASGIVSRSNVPAFCAGSTQGTHTTNVSAVLDFGFAAINIGSHYNTGTYRFTAPISGVYYFHSTIYTQQASLVGSICWRKNGAQYSIFGNNAIFYKASGITPDHTIGSSIMLSLVVNDFVDLCVRAGSPNLQWFGQHSWFMGYLIG